MAEARLHCPILAMTVYFDVTSVTIFVMDRLPFFKLEILVLKKGLPVQEVPEKETWRLGLLDCLMRERASLESEGKNAKDVIAMLSSLCAA